MPLVSGPSLSLLLARYRPTLPEALAIFSAIVEGVAHAHAHGLIHRDLKPANVLLEPVGGQIVPKVADFGLVKESSQGPDGARTVAGIFMGTPAYAAPEQLHDAAQVDARADLFSLGVLMVELLTGQRPFPGQSIASLLDAHRSAPLLHGLPGPLVALARRLLELQPTDRLASCAALQALLPPSDPAALRTDVLLQAAQAAAPAHQGPASQTFFSSALSAVTPAAAALPSSPNNLTTPRDGFLGRARDLAALQRMLTEQRLVTLVGTGGVGKTRLAREVGSTTLGQWPGGVWLCDLTQARSEDDLVGEVSRVLGLSPGRQPAAQLAQALQDRPRTLLILDNAEQIAAAVVSLGAAWLEAAPTVHLLVTSRARLHARGEAVYLLDVLSEEDAIALFNMRAGAADHRFSPEATPRAEMVALVELLDRLPLAVELAAARVRLMSPPQILRRMTRRFEVLKSQAPGVSFRQQTLRATLRWSWELLSPEEQSALAQCSVFVGGMTLEAAEEILVLEGDAWVGDVLTSLVDKSLLSPRTSPRTRENRLTMLLSIQEFAAEQLQDRAAVEDRHARYFAALGDVPEGLSSPEQQQRRWLLLDARENLVAAARRAARQGQAELATRCALASVAGFKTDGPYAEGLALLAALHPLVGLSAQTQIELLTNTARFHHLLGDHVAAERLHREALTHAEALGAPGPESAVRGNLGILFYEQGRLQEALEAFRAAMQLSQVQGDPARENNWLNHCGVVLRMLGRTDEAIALHERGLRLSQQLGSARNETAHRISLGVLHSQLGHLEQATEAYRAALALVRRDGDRYSESVCLGNLGVQHALQGELKEARALLEEAYTIAASMGDSAGECDARTNLGHMLCVSGAPAEAAVHLERALQLARARSYPRGECWALGCLGGVHAALGYPEVALECLQGALDIALATGDRRSRGIWISRIGALRAERDPAAARTLLQEAEDLLREVRDNRQLAATLCARALLERDADRPLALRDLAEAERIALELRVAEKTELGQILRRAQQALAQETPT